MRRVVLMAIAGAAGLAALAAAGPPDATEAKIRLLASALRARDEGDLATACSHLEALLALAPGDESTLRLLAGVQRAADRLAPGAPPASEPGPRAANELEELAQAEERRQRDSIAEAQRIAAVARERQRAGRLGEAREAIERQLRMLPRNPATADMIAELEALQREMSSAQVALPADGERDPMEHDLPAAPSAEADPAEPESRAEADADSRAQAGAKLLRAVDRAWRLPGPLPAGGDLPAPAGDAESPIWKKLRRITLPSVSFNGLPLARVVNTLSAVSAEFDTTGTLPPGVNIVLVDPGGANPAVSLTLRNLPLKRVLDFVAAATGQVYEVQDDVVVFRSAAERGALETAFLPIARAAVLRMTGRGAAPAAPGLDVGAGGTGGPGPLSVEAEGRAIRGFLQLAGVDFEGTPGSSLAFDGSQLFVTHTARHLARVRNILKRYAGLRQVEIEAKFMEVQEGVLEELGVQWNVSTKDTQRNAGARAVYSTGRGGNRTLNEAFSFSSSGRTLDITAPGATTLANNADGSQTAVASPGISLSLPTAPPTIPGGVSLGAPNATLANITGIVGEFDVNALVRALAQKSGTELLSAPRLTVLSGNPATITVAQELRYPQSYGEIQSQVGTGSVSGGGSAGVSITSGTPQEFTTRNIGVELRVTPTVEEDERSISLDLNPKVTEFEGFVEYGGPSVAISGGTTVTVPPGFYQPIFAVREVTTRVTIWDGATLVMGGLTREDVKKVRDKVPVLGSIPLLGRLFRSEGESAQKRNLLIFVTARMVNPGGGLRRAGQAGSPRAPEGAAIQTGPARNGLAR